MTREQIIKIMRKGFEEMAFRESSQSERKYFKESTDAILALPLDMPLNLSIYKKARTLSYHSFCEWFNNEIKKRNQ